MAQPGFGPSQVPQQQQPVYPPQYPPQYQYPPPYPYARPKSKLPIVIGIIVAIVVVVAVVAACLLLFQKEGGKVTTRTYQQLMDDYEYNMDNATHTYTSNFKSLNEGDTVIIRDTIADIHYYGGTTQIAFSYNSGSSGFGFQGDLTSTYDVGDTVEITLHIIHVHFTETMYGVTYTVDGETFEEVFDETTHESKSIPQNCIKLVSTGGPTGEAAPYATLSCFTSGTESGKTQVNITWTIVAPSRADIKWADVPQAYMVLTCEGVSIKSLATITWPTGTYVTGGDVIKTRFNRADITAYKGKLIQIILVHAPTGGTFATASVMLDWTT